MNNIEDTVIDDNVYSVVMNKRCCFTLLEMCKTTIQYIKCSGYINIYIYTSKKVKTNNIKKNVKKHDLMGEMD